MSATLSHLQLETYFLSELSYSLKDNLETPPQKAKTRSTVEVEISDVTTPLGESGHDWRCELTINSKDEDQAFYDFRIVMVGFFKMDLTLNTETAKRLAETNCPAVLYSTSREIIATVTRRSPYPGTLLPLVTFLQLPEEVKPAKPAIVPPKKTPKKAT